MVFVGLAGWRLPRELREWFPAGGTHLQRYAGVFGATEINASFYRSQRRSLYAKWSREAGAHFRFAVKMPQALTHGARLRHTEGLDAFLDEVDGLGDQLGPLLLQLPPSLALEPEHVDAFLSALRERFAGPVACEPRHSSWFTAAGHELLARHAVARVVADPPVTADGAVPGGDTRLRYYRYHGSPERFRSSYSDGFLRDQAASLADAGSETWCIFNNTATTAGLNNALTLQRYLAEHGAG